jgi:methyl-accepting chemotaxis protein
MLKKITILNQLRVLIGIAFIAIALVAIQGCYDLYIAVKVMKKNYDAPIKNQQEISTISNLLSQSVLLLEQASDLEKIYQTSDQVIKQDAYSVLLKNISEQIDKKNKSIENLWKNYSASINLTNDKNTVDTFNRLFIENFKEQIQLSSPPNQKLNKDTIEQRLVRANIAVTTMQQWLSELNSIQISKYKIQSEQYENLQSLYKNLVISCMVFLAILLILLIWISRNINHTIHKYLGSSPEVLYQFVNELLISNTLKDKDPLRLKNTLINVKTAIQVFQENISRLLIDTQQIQYAVSIGDTEVRGNPQKHSKEYRKTIETFNTILDQILLNHKQIQTIHSRPLEASTATQVKSPEIPLETAEENILLKKSTEDISLLAEEALVASRQLAQMNTSQLAALQYAANHMQFLADSIEQNKNTTQQAHQLTLEIMQSAQNEERELQAIACAIDSINKNTHKIQSQISIIDNIALQGDILAFNVAIEAARFGDEGRGFSVIATEVRNLSQRAISSTQTLKDLISDTFVITDDGNQRLMQAENSARDIIHHSNAIEQSTHKLITSADQHVNSIRELTQANEATDSHLLQQYMLSEYQKEKSLHLQKSSNDLNAFVNPTENSNKKTTDRISVRVEDQSKIDSSTSLGSTENIPKATESNDVEIDLAHSAPAEVKESIQIKPESTLKDQKLTQPAITRTSENDWVLF